MGKLGGDVYVVLLPCVDVVDGARGLPIKLFLDIRNLSVLDRAASGPVLDSMITMTAPATTTASASTAWSTAAAWARLFYSATITLIPYQLFLLKYMRTPALHVAAEVIVTHI